MFVTDRLVYLQLQKTGCTHIVKLLNHVCHGQQIAQHNRLPEDLRQSGRFIIGSIRDPWDWYVSLWAFGCSRRGALYHRLANPDLAGHAAEWRSTYADVNDPSCFREWLCRIHDPAHRHALGERYGESPAGVFCGFYTYRYACLYAEQVEQLYSDAASSLAGLRGILRTTVLDFTIRTERLEEDMLAVLGHCGIALSAEQVQHIRSAPKTNASRSRREASFYYDDDAIALVRARETIVIEHHGYTEPPVAPAGASSARTPPGPV